jgi:hypothetical protein
MMGSTPHSEQPLNRGPVEHSSGDLTQLAARNEVLDLPRRDTKTLGSLRDSKKTHDR